jgi:molybdate transport system substrate-binding protein
VTTVRPRRLLPGLCAVAGLALGLGACAGNSAPAANTAMPVAGPPSSAPAQNVTLDVFAAASLTEAFKELGAGFAAAHPGVTPRFNFAGSQQLALQINDGAPADVFASANTKQMDAVIKTGEVVSGTQHAFTRNKLVLVYPKDNPAGVQGLADLAKAGVKVVLAAKAVPAGNYALQVLKKASARPDFTSAYSPTVMANVVSFEEDVEGVLGKVALGEADAGIVYVSDLANTAAAKVGHSDIPDDLNAIASYPIAPLAHANNPDLARAFVDYVQSPAGQAVLAKHGFLSTAGNAAGPAASPSAASSPIQRP